MSESTTTIHATFITESGDVIPIVVYVPEAGEAVAFPVIEEEETPKTLPKPVRRTRRGRQPPSAIHRGAFCMEDQIRSARGERGPQWVGNELHFASFSEYGQTFVEQLAHGRLWVRAPDDVPVHVGHQHCLKVRVPEHEPLDLVVRVVEVQPSQVTLSVGQPGRGTVDLAPELLRRQACA